MADVRNELRPLDMLEPSDLWEKAQRREPSSVLEPTPSHGRRVVMIVAVLALAIATTSLAIVALRPGPRTPASGGATPSANYVISHIRFHSALGPGGIPPPEPRKASVTFRYAWSDDRYPGAHQCTLEMAGAGKPLYEKTFEIESLQRLGSADFDVPSRVRGHPEVSCNPQRLDTPVAYDITDVHVERTKDGFDVVYKVAWPDGVSLPRYPGENMCSVSVHGPNGFIAGGSFTLAVPPGTYRKSFKQSRDVAPGDAPEELDATVACHTWTTGDANPPALTGEALAQQLGLVKHPWPPGTHIDSGPDGVTASDGQDMSDCQPTGPNDVVLVQKVSEDASTAFYCVHGDSQIDAWVLAQRLAGHIPTDEQIAQHRRELSGH